MQREHDLANWETSSECIKTYYGQVLRAKTQEAVQVQNLPRVLNYKNV